MAAVKGCGSMSIEVIGKLLNGLKNKKGKERDIRRDKPKL